MSDPTEALARALLDYGISEDRRYRLTETDQAERILADPGPLLDALAEAGVLTVHESPRPGCRDCRAYVRGHIHRRYVTEWMPTDA